MDLGLKGKNAAITGSSRGIGNAIANSLADEGCNVALSALNQPRLDEAVAEIEAMDIMEHHLVRIHDAAKNLPEAVFQ